MSVESRSIQEHVMERLDDVLDPCSCFTANPVSIVDLGLVEDVQVEGESVSIRLLPTTPLCLYMGQIMDEAEMEVLKIDGIDTVDLEQIDEKLWRPERMADYLREARDERRLIKTPAADSQNTP